MPRPNKNAVFTLNGGEVSPLVSGRADLDKYRSFQKTLNNFIVEPQGAIKRRQGTIIESRLGDVDTFIDSIIEPWIVDRQGYFQMLFVNNEIRFFNQNGVQVFTLAIPYSPSDFDRLYFRQVIDIMYVCHPDYPVKIISRTEQFVWTIEDAVFNGGPYNDNFETSSTVTVTEDGAFPAVTIAAVDPIFASTDVGRTMRVRHPDGISDSDRINSTQTSTPLPCGGQTVTLTTGDIWEGQIELQVSLDDQATWQTIGSISSNDNNNGQIVRDVIEYNAYCRIRYTHVSGIIDWALDVEGSFYNYYEITAYTDENNVDATVISGFEEDITANWEWGLGSFSETTGYPTAVDIFNERLVLGGVYDTPSTVYMSQTIDWSNFLTSATETSPFSFTLNSDIRDRILWFAADQQLIAGTSNAEWTISARNSTTAVSLTNINVSRQNDFGSDPVQPVRGDDTTYFIEVGGRRVRSLNYLFDSDSYTSYDMSILADHLTQDAKIVKIAFTRTPDKIIWCLLDDGTLLTFTSEPEQNVGAWSKHPLQSNTQEDMNSNWELQTTGQVIDINSVLTEAGDVVGLVIQRQDGVYYEVLEPSGNCIDAQTVFENISQNDVLALVGDEDFTYWNDAFQESQVPFEGLGSFLRLDFTVTGTIKIFFDGNQLTQGDNYMVVRDELLYWIPDALDTSLITVTENDVPVPPANFYTVLGSDCLIVQAKPLETILVYTIYYNAVLLTEDLDYFAMQGDTQFLIIEPAGGDPDLVTVEVGAAIDDNLENDDNDDVFNDSEEEILIEVANTIEPLSEDQYEVFTPRILVSVFGQTTSTAYFGLKIYSIAELVDLYNIAQYGGGLGGNRRDVEADVYVYDSVGFDFTSNAGLGEETFWEEALFQDQMVVMDEKIPLFTGKKKVRTLHGYTSEANIGIRSDSPYCLTVTQIGVYGAKTSSRSTN